MKQDVVADALKAMPHPECITYAIRRVMEFEAVQRKIMLPDFLSDEHVPKV